MAGRSGRGVTGVWMSTTTSWQQGDQEAIRQALSLPATIPCLEAITRSMAELQHQHPAGVLSARALLDAVAVIDQQLLAGGVEQEQAIETISRSGPIAGSVAAGGDAPLQKADVIAYDTSLLREDSKTTYASPRAASLALLQQRRRYGEQVLLLLPGLVRWVSASTTASAMGGSTALLRG